MDTEAGFGSGAAGGVVMPCPDQPPLHWIEIELHDQSGRPVPYEEYLLKLPSGEEVRGYLDGDGFARLSSFSEAGVCEVRFPTIDRAAWRYDAAAPAREVPIL